MVTPTAISVANAVCRKQTGLAYKPFKPLQEKHDLYTKMAFKYVNLAIIKISILAIVHRSLLACKFDNIEVTGNTGVTSPTRVQRLLPSINTDRA